MTTVQERLTTSLADRYTVVRELGAGGMATVYLAHDIKHERDVAIKVLHPDLGAALGAERFLSEIRTTAKLQHPHILMLIDSGEIDGEPYYVMPFIDGESLRARIAREGALPLSDAIRIAACIADALEYAHRLGVVHRDIKPENILLRDELTFVADFGIALSTASTHPRLTGTGLALGTPMYMSPEQFLGDAPVDARSDLYSLGCVLFEMLTGRLPFTGASPQAMLADRLLRDAPLVRSIRADVPAMVELVLARALAREAGDRHASVGEFGAALHAELSGASVRGSRVTPFRTDSALPGRGRETADALEVVERLMNGRGGVLLLAGEPGVGKTRLAQAILSMARSRGALALVGRCNEMEGVAPFTPFAEVLDYVARLVPPHTLRALLGDAAAEVARVQPLLRQLFPDIPEPADLPPELVRTYLFTKYREFSHRAARHAPQVVLLDDLHWADEASLMLLEYLASSLADVPLLFVGTYRDVDLEVGRPFAATLERMTRQRHARRIAVRRLDTDGVTEQLAQLGGSAPPRELVTLLYAETDGNPFFVEEVFQHLREEGKLFDATGAWRTDLHADRLEVPEGVKLVIGKRLERLGDACRTMLTVAATIGSRFAVPILAGAQALDEAAMLDALDVAAGARIIEEERGSREGAYRFSHELIRQTLLSALSIPRRQRLHMKIAAEYERRTGERGGQMVSDLAYHLFQAGGIADPVKTVSALVSAAAQAHASGADAEALLHCERAASVEELTDPLLLAAIDRQRGNAFHGLGRWTEAIDYNRRAFERIMAIPDAVPSAEHVLDLSTLLSWFGHQGESAALSRRALARTSPANPRDRSLVLASTGAFVAVGEGRYEEGRALLHEGRDIAVAIGDREMLAFSFVFEQYIGVNLGLFDQQVAGADTVLGMLDERRHRGWCVEVSGLRMIGLLYSGQCDRWRNERERTRVLAEESGHVGASLVVSGTGGEMDYLANGELAAFLEFTERHRATWAIAGPHVEHTSGFEAVARLMLGEAAQALNVCEQARARFPVNAWQGLLEGAELLIAAHLDDAAFESRRVAWSHLVVGTEDGPGVGRSIYTYRLAQAHFVRGEFEALATLDAPLQAVLARGHRYGTDMAVGAIAAAAACAAGDIAHAVHLGEKAVSLWTHQAHQLLLAHSQWMLGWVLQKRNASGDAQQSLDLLGASRRTYDSCGAVTNVRQLDSLLSRG